VFAFLADYAYAHPDGRLYVVGGSFTKLFAPEFPFDYPQLALAMKFEFPREAMGEEYPLVVDLSDSRGNSLSTGEFTIEVPRLTTPLLMADELPSVHAVFVQQQVTFPAEGRYAVDTLLGGNRISSLPLWVVRIPSEDLPVG
jgi:hypothetical protein